MDRRAAIPVAVDVDPTRVRISPTGVKEAVYNQTYTEYDAGRLRAGYACLHCGEPHEEAFPKVCICGYPMRDRQAQDFAEQFEGYTTVGPSRSLAEIRAADEEAKARAQYGKAKPTSRIWLPSKVNR